MRLTSSKQRKRSFWISWLNGTPTLNSLPKGTAWFVVVHGVIVRFHCSVWRWSATCIILSAAHWRLLSAHRRKHQTARVYTRCYIACPHWRLQSPETATICRRIRRQSPFWWQSAKSTTIVSSNSQVIGCEDRLRNDHCVGWGVKLYLIQSNTIVSSVDRALETGIVEVYVGVESGGNAAVSNEN